MSGTAPYVRVLATRPGHPGVDVFVAVDHLRRDGRLTEEQADTCLAVVGWFQEHLPTPDRSADGNGTGAVTWFKSPVPAEMLVRIDQMCAILAAHDVPVEILESANPGTVVYEDDFQVAVPRIRHVLFDADGVLQVVPGGWYAAMEPYLGDRAREFLHATWRDERPMLTGQGDYLPLLAAALADYGVTEPVDVVYRSVWHRIERIEESFAVVEALRRNGYGVHLGTNQERNRGDHMRSVLGYDDIFDTSHYSYDLGFAKPDPAFFAEASRRIGVEPSTVLFIDDSIANVEGARSAGLAAVHWAVEHGHPALVERLAQHGVDARLTVH